MKPVKLIGARFTPLWSGNALSKMYRSFFDCGNIGESWETSTEYNAEATALKSDGAISFREYINVLGLNAPPLVKLLDSAAPLSIQVHPDDSVAQLLGGTSKSEIWYVLASEKNAEIIYGTSDGVTISDARNAIANGKIESLLRRVPVNAGDIFMIPPGLIHSLGGGITVLEIQDRAGTTYRVKDLAGNRETHIKESLECLRIYSDDQIENYRIGCCTKVSSVILPGDIIACTAGYTVTKCVSSSVSNKITIPNGGIYMFCEKGRGIADGMTFEKGDSLFFPVGCMINLEPDSSAIFVK